MYLATECALGYEIPALNGGQQGLYSFHLSDSVFTFRKLEGGDRVLTVGDLQVCDDVELLLTTPGGLINYRVGDCLKVRSVRPLLFEITGRIGQGLTWPPRRPRSASSPPRWRAFSLGPLLGARYMRRVLAAEIRDGIPWAGMFSNLGAWPARIDGRGAEDTWIFCPPVSRLQPLGAGAVTSGGRLTLALQAHPALRASQEKVARWLDIWRDEAAAVAPMPGNQT